MATYGYARCSTNETRQDVERQTRELKKAGAKIVFTEYEHGTAEHKAEQEALFEKLVEGDTIIVTEVSRLSRSTQQLCKLIDTIKAKKIRLQILNSVTIDCRNGNIDPMTKAFLQMAGVFSELEREMISERVKSGMANAASKGHKAGRRATTRDDIPATFYKHYPAFKSGQLNKVEFARVCSLSRPTLDKYIKLVEDQNNA